MNYIQVASNSRSSGEFRSDYSPVMLRLGYCALLYQKHKLEVVGSYGRGRFHLKDLMTKESSSPYISSYMLDINLSFTLAELYNSKIDFIFGIGMYKNDVNKISLGSYNFSRKDFAEDVFLTVGLGFNF